jgi:uncharacterized protein YlxW (UPF0749 family)
MPRQFAVTFSARDQVSEPADDHRSPGWDWRTLWKAGAPRLSRAQIVVALLCGLLGFGLATQVHSEQNSGLSSASQSDLVDILDNLSARSERLRSEVGQEQSELSKLDGTGNTTAALQDAEQRASTLKILAGTIGATGPGIDLTIQDPGHAVTADVLLDTMEELRDAGAEALEIEGGPPHPAAVRLVASSYFLDAPGIGTGIVADGTTLEPPYDVIAIGDPHTLDAALGIPGGVLDTLKGKNASGSVQEMNSVQITALYTASTPTYARPAPTSSGAG